MVRHHLHDNVHGVDVYDQSTRIIFSNGQGPNAG
jgi:hypothetical protein